MVEKIIRTSKLTKSFRPPFSKGGAHPRRGALVALRRARNSCRRFFLPSFFFAPAQDKEKAGFGL